MQFCRGRVLSQGPRRGEQRGKSTVDPFVCWYSVEHRMRNLHVYSVTDRVKLGARNVVPTVVFGLRQAHDAVGRHNFLTRTRQEFSGSVSFPPIEQHLREKQIISERPFRRKIITLAGDL